MNNIIEVDDATLAEMPSLSTEPLRYSPPAISQPSHPMALISMAVEKGMGLDYLERLMDLQTRYEASEARKAFNEALAAFKSVTVIISKTKHVNYSAGGGSVDFWHASIGDVVAALSTALSPHGLSLRWDVKQPGGGMIEVTCILSHRLGHSESVTMTAPKDDSGKKNTIQQIASAVTYLERYTALAVTGVATRDQGDDDGAGAGDPPPPAQSVEAVRSVQRSAPADDVPGKAPASVAGVPQGMVRVLKARMEAGGKTEDDLKAKFGHGFEGVALTNINDFMAWASAR